MLRRRSDGVEYSFLKGMDIGSIAVPAVWRPPKGWDRNTDSVPNASLQNGFQYLRREGGVEAYLDKQTGKEVFIGRMYPDPPGMNIFTDYYKLGAELVQSYIELDGAGRRVQGIYNWEGRRAAERGIEYLKIATITDSGNWAADWFLGKAYQALADHANSYGYFKSAHRMNPGEDFVCRELSRECPELGKTEEGVSIAQTNVKLSPGKPELACNLGVALFLNGDLEEAKCLLQQIRDQAPDDPIPGKLLAIIAQVQSGKRKQPRTLGELQKRG